MASVRTPVDSLTLSRLRWRCRRGMLENDLLIERFFERHAHDIDAADALAMEQLMDLSDNDLLDLFLRRCEPQGALDTAEVRNLLERIRMPI